MSWATRNAREVKFQVDNSLLSAGYPTNGVGDIVVPCDGREHSVVLQATGAGGQAAIARHVNTSNSPPPSTAPSVTAFDLLEDVTCTGSTVEVAAGWSTTNAQAVNFSVDGQPLPAAAGFPVTGAGNIQVPCDGKSHKVTLTATSEGLDPWLEVGFDTPLGFATILSNDDSDGLNSRIEIDPSKFAGSDAADWWSKLRVRVSAPTGSTGDIQVTATRGGD